MLFIGTGFNLLAQTNNFRRIPQFSIIPAFTNNPYALFVITNLLAEPQPELSVPAVSHAGGTSGTFWTLKGTPVPLPFDPYPELPVYQISTNGAFIIDDRSVDYATLTELEALEAMANGATNQTFVGCATCALDEKGLLWIEVPTNSLATPGYFTVAVHNTVQSQTYDILTTPDLLAPWVTELVVTGAVGTITPVEVPRSTYLNKFVRARTSTAYSFYLMTPPLSQYVCEYDAVTFYVETGGNTNLTFQWTFNGNTIPGATNSSYTIYNVQFSDAGDYACIISDGANSLVAADAQLTVGYADGNPALVWVSGSRQDYTFRSGVTYYIGEPIQLFGQTKIEGGAVLKFDSYYSTNSTLVILGGLTCKTEPYNPAILTSLDDDSVGTYIFFSSGFPQSTISGTPYLEMACATSNSISNLRFCFADWGVTTPTFSRKLDVWDCQFLLCNFGLVNLVPGSSTNGLHNVLFSLCNAGIAASTNAITINGEHVTADVGNFCLAATTPSLIALTNCIVLGNAISASTFLTANVAINPNKTNFVTVDDGYYYLAANSPLHGSGTSNISPQLQTELRHKTTFAPIHFPVGWGIEGQMTLSPQVPRYTNGAPDIGYYYDVLDYSIAQFYVLGGTITVLPGTVVGVRADYDAVSGGWTTEGFFVAEGGSIVSHGLPDQPNIFTSVGAVQEVPNFLFTERYQIPIFLNYEIWLPEITLFVSDCETNDPAPPTLDFRFSNFYLPSLDQHFCGGVSPDLLNYSSSSTVYLTLQDCSLHGGQINLNRPDFYSFPLDATFGQGAVTWKNNLFENVSFNLDPTVYWINQTVSCDLQLQAYNNLFKNSAWMFLGPFPATAGNWVFKDNFFDKVHFIQDTNQPLDFDYNGYWPLKDAELLWSGDSSGLLPSIGGNLSGGHEQALTTAPPYQTGPFGNYYLSQTTPLYQTGSRTANEAGLTQYTTFINQIKDTSNAPVNIGLHYITATNNAPLDFDGDGVPDYVEAEHGTEINNAMSDSITNDTYNGAYDDVDLSGDGLTGMAKKHLALNPSATEYPLNFLSAATTALASGTITIPLNIGTNVDESEPLQLFVDGSEANATVFKEGTNWLAMWDTTTITNGLHWLALKFCCEHETGSSFLRDFYGSPVFVNVSNVLTFTLRSKNFCDLLVVDAIVNNGADTYSINVYDLATSNLLTTLSGSVSNGTIQMTWDLTDGNGNVIADGPVGCEYSLSSAANPNGSPAITTLIPVKVFHNPFNDKFAVAWGVDNVTGLMQGRYSAGMSSIVDLLNGFFDPFPDPNLTYDIKPAGSSGNVNNPGGTLSFNFGGTYADSKDVLMQALQSSGNFFWVGHAKPSFIYPNLNDESLKLTAKEIGQVLNNLPKTISHGTNYILKPYKLVILFACQAYSGDFADAFGIVDYTPPRVPLSGPPNPIIYDQYLNEGRATNTVDEYLASGKVPQAYVGWPCNINAPGNKDEVNLEQANIFSMFAKWQDDSPEHFTISQCMNSLAYDEAHTLTVFDPSKLAPDKIEGIRKWCLSGCKDLRITNRYP